MVPICYVSDKKNYNKDRYYLRMKAWTSGYKPNKSVVLV